MSDRNGKVVEIEGKEFGYPKRDRVEVGSRIYGETHEKASFEWEKNEWGGEKDQGKGVKTSSSVPVKEENM